jgi:hypothetical protein
MRILAGIDHLQSGPEYLKIVAPKLFDVTGNVPGVAPISLSRVFSVSPVVYSVRDLS